jgi:ferredoxin
MRITIDARACAATGFCTQIAPDVFCLPEPDGPATAVVPGADQADAVLEAEAACPTGAITVDPGVSDPERPLPGDSRHESLRSDLGGGRDLDEDAGLHNVGGQACERADDRTFDRPAGGERPFD